LSCINYRYQDGPRVTTDSGDDIHVYRYYDLPDSVLDERELYEQRGWTARAEIGQTVWRRESNDWVVFRTGVSGWYWVRPGTPHLTVWWLANGSPIDWNEDGTPEADPEADPVRYDLNPYYDDDGVLQHRISELCARYEPPLLRTKIYGDIFHSATPSAMDALSGPADGPGGECDLDEVLATDSEYGDGVDNDGDGRIDEGFGDADQDGISDPIDNCPLSHNPNQFDADGGWVGDECEGLPAAPAGVSLRAGRLATLIWTPSQAGDIIGHNVYRKLPGEGDFSLLGGSYPTTLGVAFRDDRCVAGATYVVSAVNLHLIEGARSVGVVVTEADCSGRELYLPLVLRTR